MIDVEEWLKELDEGEDPEIKNNEEYQKKLFDEYVMRGTDHRKEREQLLVRSWKGEPLMGEHGLRRELAAFDLQYFGRAYLSHYFKRKSPHFHEELDEIWTNGVLKGMNPAKNAKEISYKNGSRNAVAAPRGHAKSTNFTFKDDLHAILYGYKHYILILSDSSEQAEGFLEDIKTELEENGNIIMDFGELKGDRTWKTGVILTKNGIKVEAIGSGKKVRGRKHRNWRPDLIVLDDIENDENVNTPDQRKKLKSWFDKAVSKAGDTYTDIMYIGTILHYDSLLSKVLVNPEYETKKYRAVISFATNTKLWDEWEAIYTNLFDDDHKANARKFYEEHEQEMLAGTEVLWKEKLPYYSLMVERVSAGEAAFNSELQNDPVDPDNATFNPEWFDFYEPELMDWKKPEFVFIGANDPSLGKNKKSDTSSIINIALSTKTGYMYVVDASVEKRKPDVIIDDVFEMNRRLRRDYGKGFYKFGVETVQFQYFFKEVMAKKSAEEGEYIPIEEIQSSTNKVLRIESLQPLIKNKYLKFNREHKTLLKQMEEFPMGRNDDGPDGLQMAVQLAQTVSAIVSSTQYQSIIKRRFRMGKGAY
jgi:predicted phage terminase large subunit-like protein